MILLFLATPGPVRIVTDAPAPLAAGSPNYFAFLSVACGVAALAIIAWWVRQRHIATPPATRAFNRLCRMNKINPAERALLNKLAATERNLTPMAVMISPGAFARARTTLSERRIGGDAATLVALERKLQVPENATV